jgi:hypothetical protein
LIKKNASMICGFAHPTVTYEGGSYWTETQSDGTINIKLEIRYVDLFGNNDKTTLHFGFDRLGGFSYVGNSNNGAFLFTGILIETIKALAEEENPELASDPAWRIVKSYSDPKKILSGLLQLNQ